MSNDDRNSALWVTANERFKSKSGDWMAIGVIAAVLAHGALFAFFPEMTADDIDFTGEESKVVDLPPEVEIPPPPEQISRPATPRVAAAALDEDITIARTDFESNPVENLPPPPAGARPSDVPSYIPRDVEPRLTNGRQIERVLKQRYPSMLREAGIGGTVVLYVFVDEKGLPTNTQVQQSSGYPQLDAAAAEVVDEMEFSPAMNRDRPVGVWVLQRVDFSTRS
ncbi:MAG TPA: energy transducer TonB [Gemmatimonadota bacterium]|nr:energy transducer TonB [Gemmatimonadota bacterium]